MVLLGSSSTLFAATAVVAIVLATAASDVCEKSRSGAPCEIDGKPSRCWNYTCRAVPKPCASDMKELQSCDDRFGVCTSFSDKNKLHCVNSTEVRYYKNYDACDGKTDGATCTPLATAGWNEGVMALFEEKPGKCKDRFCNPEYQATCIDKPDGAKCEFVFVSEGFTNYGRGMCEQSKTAKIPLRFCNTSATAHLPALEPVGPVQVYDNRPNVTDPTNVKTADLCNIFNPGTP
ncbi:hypothetical protein ATCC90586_004755 [Pythium insidiosum]|nr:hypothetical protein ATCC90586_004755 [Pythium insidiosum]